MSVRARELMEGQDTISRGALYEKLTAEEKQWVNHYALFGPLETARDLGISALGGGLLLLILTAGIVGGLYAGTRAGIIHPELASPFTHWLIAGSPMMGFTGMVAVAGLVAFMVTSYLRPSQMQVKLDRVTVENIIREYPRRRLESSIPNSS